MPTDPQRRLESLDRRRGRGVRELRLGPLVVCLGGLDDNLELLLEQRWGSFLEPQAQGSRPTAAVELFDAGAEGWLPTWDAGEGYRLEAREADDGGSLLCSYHFALAETTPGRWRLGLTRTEFEPIGRIMENAIRALVARLAAAAGGFAMHAAGVLRDERAWLVAGPSRAGKSTAVRLLQPAPSLGDDFGLVLPDGAGGWIAPALPFDNRESVDPDAIRGAWPVAGIWRLEQAEATSVEACRGPIARALLMGMLAFPWALPEHAGALLDAVGALVDDGRFARLRFPIDGDLWTVLVDRPSGNR